MLNQIQLIILFVSLVSLLAPGCDEKQTEPEWDPSGLYNVTVQVQKRPPCLIEDDTLNISYLHEIKFGHVFDTTSSKCCYWGLGRPCAKNYIIYNVRIFKSNNSYFLYNTLDTFNGVPKSTHIPLIGSEKCLKLKNNLEPIEQSFRVLYQNGSIMWSSVTGWPTITTILDFELNKDLTGHWVIIEDRDYCNTTLSNGEQKEFTTSEFATLTFERIGD